MSLHTYAQKIEDLTRQVFHCDKFQGDIGGIAETNFIEGNPFIPIIAVIGNLYNKVDDEGRDIINEFVKKYDWETKKSISDFTEKEIKEIIEQFTNIVNLI